MQLVERLHVRSAVGDALALRGLAFKHLEGTYGVPLDVDEGIRLLRLAAAPSASHEKGLAEAQLDLANIFDNGLHGLPVDEPEAAALARRAAEQGHERAMALLGFIHADGRGVRRDAALAAWWWHLGCRRNDPDCQFHLALAYLEAEGVPRDGAEAFRLMQIVAGLGTNSAAMVNLGRLYLFGEDPNGGSNTIVEPKIVPRDYDLAAHWFQRAGDEELWRAAKGAARLFKEGQTHGEIGARTRGSR
jgi:TPR repeat protein